MFMSFADFILQSLFGSKQASEYKYATFEPSENDPKPIVEGI